MFSDVILKGKLHFSCSAEVARAPAFLEIIAFKHLEENKKEKLCPAKHTTDSKG